MKQNDYFDQLADGRFVVTLDIAAMICGVTVQSYRGWMVQDYPPPYDSASRKVPLKELGQWIRAEQVLKRGRGGQGFPYLPNLDRLYNNSKVAEGEHPETRLKRLQADKIQIDIERTAEKLIPVDEARQAWSTVATRVKTRLLGLPTKLAPLLAGITDQHEVQAVLSNGVHEALEALADGNEL